MAEQIAAISSSAWKVVTSYSFSFARVVQDRARRRDRIGAEEHRQAGELAAGHQAERDRSRRRSPCGRDPGAISARRHPDLLERPTDLGGLAIGVAGIERRDIGLDQLVALGAELGLEPLDQAVAGRDRTSTAPDRAPTSPCSAALRDCSSPNGLTASSVSRVISKAIDLVRRELRSSSGLPG